MHFVQPVDKLMEWWQKNNILGGLKVADDKLLIAVTEKRTKEDIDRMVNLLDSFANFAILTDNG